MFCCLGFPRGCLESLKSIKTVRRPRQEPNFISSSGPWEEKGIRRAGNRDPESERNEGQLGDSELWKEGVICSGDMGKGPWREAEEGQSSRKISRRSSW